MKFSAISKAMRYCAQLIIRKLWRAADLREILIADATIKKWMMRINLTTILLIIGLVQASAEGFSQINLNEKNASLKKVFRVIESQTGFVFFYNDLDLDKELITVKLKNGSIGQAMDKCLKELPLSYIIVDQTVVVSKNEESDRNTSARQILDVRGKITDNKGEPLPGAAVRVKGTNIGAITDVNGNFYLRSLDPQSVLVISYTGFVTQEIAVNGRRELTVSMVEDSQRLNELVVIGYGTQNSSEVTSAISTFKPTTENARPVLSADQMIQGRMAGVSVAAASGTPGAANRVSIRGTGSLTASNDPLYVIDGVPVVNQSTSVYNFGENINPLAALNPNDIESIDVLKDAASAAIYGSRATNGVIIITTKSGSKGKSNINVDAYTGLQNVPNLGNLKMVNSDLYVEIANEAIDNYNLQYGYSPGATNYIQRIQNPYPGMPDTDWLDLILRTAKTNSVNLSFSGGGDKGTYFISGNYTDQEGTIITNKYKKYTAKVNLTQDLNSWLKVGTNTNFSYSKNIRVPGSNLGTSTLPKSLSQRPFDRPYKPNGDYYVGGTNDLVYHNSLQVLNEENVFLDNYRLLGNIFADVKLAKDLVFKTSLGTDLIHVQDYVYYNQKHPYGTGNGRIIDNRNLVSSIVFENTLNYRKSITDLNIDALAGHSFQRTTNSTSGIDGNGFPSSSFDVLTAASVIADASTNLFGNALESYFGRVNLAYQSKYLLSMSMRADASSRFAPENRWGYFPSASLGWQVSKEDFWNVDRTDLKLKVSYGATGNQEGISNYAYQALTGGGYNYNTSSGIAVTSLGNRDLTWEKANQFDVGIDIGIDNNRFNFLIDYFVKNTNNLLYSKPIYSTSGFTSIISNIGSMKNHGLELGLTGNFDVGAVKWNTGFNISFVKNKLTSLIGNDELISIGSNRALEVGKSLGSFWVYKQTGLYQDDTEVPAPLYNIGVRAGDVKYEDVNDDGNIDINDRQIVGNSSPKLYGGWNNTLKYKDFDFTMFFTFMQGNDVYASWRINTERLGANAFNTSEQAALGRWTGPNTSNETPRAVYGLSYNYYNSSRFLEDGSFIRLRSLSLGYQLPAKWLDPIKAKRMRVYVQADNLFLLTKYSGLDPEVSSNMNPLFIGEDNLVLPQPRTINFGVNLNF